MPLSYAEWKAQKAGKIFSPQAQIPQAESLTKVGGGLGFAGDIAGLHHLGELGGSLRFFGSKNKKQADVASQGLSDITQKLVQKALSLPPGPQREQLLKIAQENEQQVGSYQGSVAQSAPSQKGILGDVAQLGLTGVSMKLPSGMGVLRSSTKVAGTNPIARLLLTKTGTSALLGGGYGAAKSFGEGATLGNIAKSAGIGTLIGGLVGLATGTIGKGFTALKNSIAQRQYAASLGLSNTPEDKAILKAALQNRMTGGYEKILSGAKTGEADIEAILQAHPDMAQKTVDISDVLTDPIVQRKYQLAQNVAGGELKANKILDNLLNAGKPLPQGQFGQTVVPNREMTLGDFVDLRRKITESSNYTGETNTGNVMRDLAEAIKNKMRGMIREASPKVGQLLQKEGRDIGLRTAAKGMLEKPVKGFGLGMINPFSERFLLNQAVTNPRIATPLASGMYNARLPETLMKLLRLGTYSGIGELVKRKK